MKESLEQRLAESAKQVDELAEQVKQVRYREGYCRITVWCTVVFVRDIDSIVDRGTGVMEL